MSASVLRSARRLDRDAAAVLDRTAPLIEAVRDAYVKLRDHLVDRELATIPVARLREVSDGRLRTAALEDAGYDTVLKVRRASVAHLDHVPGMGERSAQLAHSAAAKVASAVAGGMKVRIPFDPKDKVATALLRPLHRLVEVERLAPNVRALAERSRTELAPLLPVAAPARSRIRMWFAGRAGRASARAALATIERILAWSRANQLARHLAEARTMLRGRLASGRSAWRAFESYAPEFYGVLGEIADGPLDVAAAEGYLSDDIVARVRAQNLDDRYRRVSLRGYQSFGARFALVQRRVLLGDEMGLGKTIQAIAVLAHLRAGRNRHFLVVCPASVLVNWVREVETRSHLAVHRLHGPDRDTNLKTWIRDGEVALTTIDSLHDLDVPPAVRIAALVVDEAHYAKNPGARRSAAVKAFAERADRVLFLTGTPMENRLDEFRTLVGYLQPRLVGRISDIDAVAGATAFRQAVAPVYLRRNQEDVLAELPDLVHKDEWVEFTAGDQQLYRQAVAAGNFMAMRRAAYATGDPATSAKLDRLLDLIEEAADNGRKVVVFSHFLDVLDAVRTTLAAAPFRPRVFGPLTGALAPAKRQGLVDDFAATAGPAVLISQIQAGGVGLNIQAASVVIICEPQVKPTIEDQAVARSHRMGQVRSVQVHRLLASDTVDERMLEILSAKTKVFDNFARRSHLAASTPDATDITDASLAKQVVEAERARLSL